MQISSKRSRLEQQKASKNGEGSGKYETGVGLVLMYIDKYVCISYSGTMWDNVGCLATCLISPRNNLRI